MSEQSPAYKTELARRIANRDTELHRAYDGYKAQQRAAIKEQNEACARINAANTGMALCEKRAVEQGYPTLFTL